MVTKHGSDTVELWAKFQTDWTTVMDVKDERDFSRFEFNITFWWTSYITKANMGSVTRVGREHVSIIEAK